MIFSYFPHDKQAAMLQLTHYVLIEKTISMMIWSTRWTFFAYKNYTFMDNIGTKIYNIYILCKPRWLWHRTKNWQSSCLRKIKKTHDEKKTLENFLNADNPKFITSALYFLFCCMFFLRCYYEVLFFFIMRCC